MTPNVCTDVAMFDCYARPHLFVLVLLCSAQPWIWDAATGEIRHRLPANNSPVLDVASYHGSFPGRGLFAAVSQGDVRLYQTFTQC